MILFDSSIGPQQVPLLRVRVDLEVNVMKEYSPFLKVLGLELDGLVSYPGHLLGEVLLFSRHAVSVFYSPSRLGWERKGRLESQSEQWKE